MSPVRHREVMVLYHQKYKNSSQALDSLRVKKVCIMSVASDLCFYVRLCFHKVPSGAMSASVMRTSGLTPVLSCQRPDNTYCAAARLRFHVRRHVILSDYTLAADSGAVLILFSQTPDSEPSRAHLPSHIKHPSSYYTISDSRRDSVELLRLALQHVQSLKTLSLSFLI